MLLFAKCFIFALVVDDSNLNMTGKNRWVCGYFAIILAFFVIFWNTICLMWKLFEYWNMCRLAMKNKMIQVPGMIRDEDLEQNIVYKTDSKGGYQTINKV